MLTMTDRSLVVLLAALVATSATIGYFIGVMETERSRLVIRPFWGVATRLPGTEIIGIYERGTGVRVEATFGGAGQLLSEMMIARVGDLYLGVGTLHDISKAVEEGIVDPNTIRVLSYMVPLILVAKGNPSNVTGLEDLAQSDVSLCLTNPSYGVGLFVKELLEHNGLWDDVEGRYVEAESGEKAVVNVIMGHVDATISWHVFYYWNPEEVEVVWIDAGRIPKVSVVPGAISVFSENREVAEVFLDYSAESRASKSIFNKYGYVATIEQAVDYTPYSYEAWQDWMKGVEEEMSSLRITV